MKKDEARAFLIILSTLCGSIGLGMLIGTFPTIAYVILGLTSAAIVIGLGYVIRQAIFGEE